MAATRRKPARARSRPKKRQPASGLPRLERHHLDLLGLALVALSVFFAFVIWLDWDGGRAGDGAVDGMRWRRRRRCTSSRRSR